MLILTSSEVLEVNKKREVRRCLKERFLELHEKAQKWEILAYHLKVICAENPEIEPLPDLENDAYLKREDAYLTIATVSKIFKHLEFVSQQHPEIQFFPGPDHNHVSGTGREEDCPCYGVPLTHPPNVLVFVSV